MLDHILLFQMITLLKIIIKLSTILDRNIERKTLKGIGNLSGHRALWLNLQSSWQKFTGIAEIRFNFGQAEGPLVCRILNRA